MHQCTPALLQGAPPTSHLSACCLAPAPRSEALDLYLFALQQLAYPATIASLFPEDPEAACSSARVVAVQDALRAVFRCVSVCAGVCAGERGGEGGGGLPH
jgi:hypothetical protein